MRAVTAHMNHLGRPVHFGDAVQQAVANEINSSFNPADAAASLTQAGQRAHKRRRVRQPRVNGSVDFSTSLRLNYESDNAKTTAPVLRPPTIMQNLTPNGLGSWSMLAYFYYFIVAMLAVMLYTAAAAWFTVQFPGQTPIELLIKAVGHGLAAACPVLFFGTVAGGYLSSWIPMFTTVWFVLWGPKQHPDGTRVSMLAEFGKMIFFVLAYFAGAAAGTAFLGVWSNPSAIPDFEWGRPHLDIATIMPGPPMLIMSLCAASMETVLAVLLLGAVAYIVTQEDPLVPGRVSVSEKLGRQTRACMFGLVYGVGYLLFGSFTGMSLSMERWLWPSIFASDFSYPLVYLLPGLIAIVIALVVVFLWIQLAKALGKSVSGYGDEEEGVPESEYPVEPYEGEEDLEEEEEY